MTKCKARGPEPTSLRLYIPHKERGRIRNVIWSSPWDLARMLKPLGLLALVRYHDLFSALALRLNTALLFF